MSIKSKILRALVGSAVSVFFVWLVLRGRDLGAIWDAAKEADLRVLAPYLGILLLIHLLRTLRWGILLEGSGSPSFSRLNRASAIGFMALVLLPFRLGELARPFLISDRLGEESEGAQAMRMSAATASIVIERLVDGLFVAGLLFVAMITTLAETAALRPEVVRLRIGALFVALAFASAGAILLLLVWQRGRAVGLVERLLSKLSPKLGARVASSLESFIGGASKLPRPARFVYFLILTAAYWGLNGVGIALLAGGFGLQLSLVQAFTVLGVLVIGVMIPAGPGMLGTFQFFVILGLGLYLPEALVDRAGVAYANVLWGMQFIQQVGLGLIFVAKKPVSLAGLFGSASKKAQTKAP